MPPLKRPLDGVCKHWTMHDEHKLHLHTLSHGNETLPSSD